MEPETATRGQPRKHCQPEDFLRAAVAVLDRDGQDRVTARSVAQEAGLSAMALYRHYRSMDHLTAALWNECFVRLRQHTERACAGRGNPADELRQRLLAYVAFGREHPHLFWFSISARPRPEQFGMENLGRSGFALLMKNIDRGIAAGCFRADLDPFQATLHISYVMIGMATFVASRALVGLTSEDPSVRALDSVDHLLSEFLLPS
jgi:AcrR family transcriptional regulator